MHSKSNVNALQISLANPLALFDVPGYLNNVQIYAVQRYKVDVTAITHNPKLFTDNMKYVVCGQNHSFDQCEWLNNIEFLKKFHIQFCLLMRKMKKATTKAAVNSIKTIPNDNDNPELAFQLGKI